MWCDGVPVREVVMLGVVVTLSAWAYASYFFGPDSDYAFGAVAQLVVWFFLSALLFRKCGDPFGAMLAALLGCESGAILTYRFAECRWGRKRPTSKR